MNTLLRKNFSRRPVVTCRRTYFRSSGAVSNAQPKIIRKDQNGYEIFDDYFTDAEKESESSNTSEESQSPKNYRRLKRMSSFSRIESSSSEEDEVDKQIAVPHSGSAHTSLVNSRNKNFEKTKESCDEDFDRLRLSSSSNLNNTANSKKVMIMTFGGKLKDVDVFNPFGFDTSKDEELEMVPSEQRSFAGEPRVDLRRQTILNNSERKSSQVSRRLSSTPINKNKTIPDQSPNITRIDKNPKVNNMEPDGRKNFSFFSLRNSDSSFHGIAAPNQSRISSFSNKYMKNSLQTHQKNLIDINNESNARNQSLTLNKMRQLAKQNGGISSNGLESAKKKFLLPFDDDCEDESLDGDFGKLDNSEDSDSEWHDGDYEMTEEERRVELERLRKKREFSRIREEKRNSTNCSYAVSNERVKNADKSIKKMEDEKNSAKLRKEILSSSLSGKGKRRNVNGEVSHKMAEIEEFINEEDDDDDEMPSGYLDKERSRNKSVENSYAKKKSISTSMRSVKRKKIDKMADIEEFVDNEFPSEHLERVTSNENDNKEEKSISKSEKRKSLNPKVKKGRKSIMPQKKTPNRKTPIKTTPIKKNSVTRGVKRVLPGKETDLSNIIHDTVRRSKRLRSSNGNEEQVSIKNPTVNNVEQLSSKSPIRNNVEQLSSKSPIRNNVEQTSIKTPLMSNEGIVLRNRTLVSPNKESIEDSKRKQVKTSEKASFSEITKQQALIRLLVSPDSPIDFNEGHLMNRFSFDASPNNEEHMSINKSRGRNQSIRRRLMSRNEDLDEEINHNDVEEANLEIDQNKSKEISISKRKNVRNDSKQGKGETVKKTKNRNDDSLGGSGDNNKAKQVRNTKAKPKKTVPAKKRVVKKRIESHQNDLEDEITSSHGSSDLPDSISMGPKSTSESENKKKNSKIRYKEVSFTEFEKPKGKKQLIHPVIDENSNIRKSKRIRIPPLEHWNFEKPIYKFDENKHPCLVGITSPILIPASKRKKRTVKKKEQKKNTSEDKDDSESVTTDTSMISVPVQPLPVINPETNEVVYIDLISKYNSVRFRGPNGEEIRDTDPYIMTTSWEQRAISSGFLIVRPSCEKPVQRLDNFSMLFILLSGKVMVTIHCTTIEAKKNDTFLVPLGNKYQIQNTTDKEAVLSFTKING